MKELKFIKVLKDLSKDEIERFHLYLKSPYFVSNQISLFLFEEVKKIEFNSILNEKEKFIIWYKLFPQQNFDDPKWRKICNDLIVELNNFFAFEQFSKTPLLKSSLQLEYIVKKDIESLSKSSITSIDNVFKKYNSNSTDFHLYSYLYNRNKYDLLNFEINIEQKSNIENVHFHLDLFYLSEKIKQLVNVITRKNDLNIPINLSLDEEIIILANKAEFLQYPEIYIYYQIYQIKKGNDKIDVYNDLKSSFLKNLIKFEIQDAVDILKETINYCNKKLNEGQQEFANEAMSWYKFGLKHDLIFSAHTKFNPGTFLNIVISGIRIKDFTWTENFIEEYQKIIPKESKKDIVTFSLARLYFNQQKLDEVIEKLRDVEFNELTYNLDAKVLLLATYFEVEEWPAMSSLAESYRTFLNRHEKDITKAKQLRYLNFIKFIKKLSRVKYQDKKAKEKLIDEIQNTEGVVNKGWLVDKAKAL